MHQTTAENTGLVETNNNANAKFYNVGSILNFVGATEEMLKFYKTKDKFVSEEGEFEIMVGCNSRDYLSTKL